MNNSSVLSKCKIAIKNIKESNSVNANRIWNGRELEIPNGICKQNCYSMSTESINLVKQIWITEEQREMEWLCGCKKLPKTHGCQLLFLGKIRKIQRCSTVEKTCKPMAINCNFLTLLYSPFFITPIQNAMFISHVPHSKPCMGSLKLSIF